MPTCRELGIGFVPYSPLGRGFLTGQFQSPADFGPTTTAATRPGSRGRISSKNLELVGRIKAIAAEKGATPSQLALAWVLAQGATTWCRSRGRSGGPTLRRTWRRSTAR